MSRLQLALTHSRAASLSLTSPHLTSPHLISPHHLTSSPHLITSPHLTAPQLTSPHLTHSHSLSLTLTHSHSLSLTLTHSHSLSLTLTDCSAHRGWKQVVGTRRLGVCEHFYSDGGPAGKLTLPLVRFIALPAPKFWNMFATYSTRFA